MSETWGYAPGEFRNGRVVRSKGHGGQDLRAR
jgi:hypothetical protein